jgi:hypothetical protein
LSQRATRSRGALVAYNRQDGDGTRQQPNLLEMRGVVVVVVEQRKFLAVPRVPGDDSPPGEVRMKLRAEDLDATLG